LRRFIKKAALSGAEKINVKTDKKVYENILMIFFKRKPLHGCMKGV